MFQIFPPHGLDQTIHVAVLVGLYVLLFTTEVFGWVWSGLVVPGYLASVFLIQPAAGVTIAFESIVTFLVARAVSEGLGRAGVWSPFFGRERFMLIILISVIVRQTSQVWLLPAILGEIDARLGTSYALEGSFSSIGLVLVPLTANMFWKVDVRRGLVQIGIPTLVTYLILRHILMPLTNLSYSSLSLTYENVALDFLASPKAYIILLTGTYVAARYNLLYGWDFSGILIPALLALACFSPIRLVTTAAEALLLVALVRAVLRLPFLATRNLEGPRKIALVFTMSFALKFALGWAMAPRTPWGAALVEWLPAVQVTDLFGFGYILPSLLAAKMLATEQVGRVLYPTYQAALVALVVGSGVGFALDKLAPAEARQVVAAPVESAPSTVLPRTPAGVASIGRLRARLDVAGATGGSGSLRRPYHELAEYADLWRAIDAWLGEPTEARRRDAVERAARRGLTLGALAGGGFALLEAEESLAAQVGWDSAVLHPGAPGPVLEVPRPATEPPSAEAAAALCAGLRCRAVIVSGVDTAGVGLAEGDALTASWAPLAVAHGQLGGPVIQVRADTAVPRGRAVLHVRRVVPEALGSLWPGKLELSWQAPPGPTLQWELERPFAVLRAHPADLWKVVAARSAEPPPAQAGVPLATFLGRRFGERTEATPAAPEPTVYVAPSETELRFLEAALAGPLLARAPEELEPGERRRLLSGLAGLVGYEVHELGDCAGAGIACWVLAEAGPRARLGWGTLAVLAEHGTPIAVEVPRPLREGGTFRLGVELWQSLAARAIAVAEREARVVAADPAAADTGRHPFQALHEAIQGSLADEGSPLVLQVRGFGAQQGVAADLVVSVGKPLLPGRRVQVVPLDPPWIRLAAALDASGPLSFAAKGVRYHDGLEDLLDLSGIGNRQLHYSTQVGGAAFALLWFSDRTREAYVGRPFAREAPRFAAAGLPLGLESATEALVAPALGPPPARPSPALAGRLAELVELARRYAAEENVHVLRALARAGGVTAGYSEELRLPWLRVEAREGREVQRALILVSGAGREEDVALSAGGGDLARQVSAEIFRRPRVIRLSGSAP
jgi:hypothetical protein